jgi:hypothetical protein
VLETLYFHRLTFRLFIVISGLLLRQLFILRVRKSRVILDTDARKIISAAHYLSGGLTIIVVVIHWLPQLQQFVLPITAITLALVFAQKSYRCAKWVS